MIDKQRVPSKNYRDLRKRSNIVFRVVCVEEQYNPVHIQQITDTHDNSSQPVIYDDEYDFMVVEPRLKAEKRLKSLWRKKLRLE